MTSKRALELSIGSKVNVVTCHYTGKMRLTESPSVHGSGTVWLFGIGEGGCLLGCSCKDASVRRKQRTTTT